LRLAIELRYQLKNAQPDFQPTLTGPSVIVRPIAAEDWTELFAVGSDPEIWKVYPRSDR
jgi:N-acetyltransferase